MEDALHPVWRTVLLGNLFDYSLVEIKHCNMKIFKIIIQDENGKELWHHYSDDTGISNLFNSKSATMGFTDAKTGKAYIMRDLVLDALNINPKIELTEF